MEEILLLNKFFSIVDTCLSCEDIAQQNCSIASEETALARMHRICVAIWETGEWPEEWTFSTFIPLPQKR